MDEVPKIEKLLSEYAESHKNPTNKLIHWFCVPLIFFTIFGMIRSIPEIPFMQEISSYLNWMNLILIIVLVYYLFLSGILFIGFIFWALLVSIGNEWLYMILGNIGTFYFSFILFVIAWIGQFVGHGIEGKKPSFLKDVQFLLIGPAWLMNFILKAVPLDKLKK